MATDTSKVKEKLSALTRSLDDLEEQLEPLFSRGLDETLAGLEKIQEAKLQTLLPYLVYDLIFTYLKTKGIDPKSHPVVGELDRIRGYFEKISKAENTQTKRVAVDKDAAGRFIKHAITQATKPQASTSTEPTELTQPGNSSASIPIKMTQKMIEREQYLQELKERNAEESDEDDATLEVFEDDQRNDENTMNVDDTKTIEKSWEVVKRRRPAIDPFTGEESGTSPAMTSDKTPAKKSKNGRKTQADASAPAASPTTKPAKKKRKKSSS